MNTTTIAPTTIDLGPLLDMRARFADQLAGIADQLDADDAPAAEVAARMLAEEEAATDTVVEQFRQLCGESVNPERYVDSFRESLDGLRVTGDLYAHLDYYNDRRHRDEVIAAIPALIDTLAQESDYWGGEEGELHRKVLAKELADAVRRMYGPEAFLPATA